MMSESDNLRISRSFVALGTAAVAPVLALSLGEWNGGAAGLRDC